VTSPYRSLAERFQGEVVELDRVVQCALVGWFKARQTPEDDMYLDGVALNLHGFNSGVEGRITLNSKPRISSKKSRRWS
jgi:hypothetical protein